MSISATPPDATPASSDQADTAAEDGWRNGDLASLRAELDRIDNAIHDLLMQRAAVVEHVATAGKPAAFRPGREAAIIRRLLGRHQGALPPVTLVRLWRELLAGTTAMQGRFSIAVCDTEAAAPISQLAREHFGALTPLRAYHSPGQALIDVSQGNASVAVMPYPSDTNTWWMALLHHKPRLHIIGRLPFWEPRPDSMARAHAVVVASTPADDSGDDWSFLGVECDDDVSRSRLSGELSAAGLRPATIALLRPAGAAVANVLVELEGHLADDDKCLSNLGPVLRRPVVLGSYAAPVGRSVR